MSRPRDPMLKEFRVIAEKGPGSVEDVCDLFTDDCILEDTASPEPVLGRAGLRAYCTEWFNAIPDLRITPLEIFEDGLVAVMYLRLAGTQKRPWLGVEPAGRRISYRALAVYRCNEQCTKVHYETLSYDVATIVAQLRGEREPEPETAQTAAAMLVAGGLPPAA
jgi:predicted ester cyclase